MALQYLILPRGGRTIVEDLTIGGLGGAFSIDCDLRTEVA